VKKALSNLPSKISDAEYQRFAEQFVDCILDPRQPWLVQYVLTGGFSTIPTDEELSSGKFAFKMLTLLERDSELWEAWLYEAFTSGDRAAVLAWVHERSIECKLTRDQMRRLLACGNSTVLRRSLKKLGKTFTFHSGAKRKLPVGQHLRLLEIAHLLEPAILKLISFPKTSRTLADTLCYLEQDHHKACEFLSRHTTRLQQALDDPKLLERAKKDLPARARVLAEALAGSDYELTFSTSREDIRQARRLAVKISL